MRRFLILLSTLLTLSACHLPSSPPPPPPGPAPNQNPGALHTDILIYNGDGSWQEEVNSIRDLIYSKKKTYVIATEDQFNQMSIADFKKYSLVIFPGGNSDSVNRVLTQETRMKLRSAVIDHGLNYLGFCSGAWLVVSPVPVSNVNSYGFQLVEGAWLEHTQYDKEELPYAIVNTRFPDGHRRKLLWFGGPVTPNVPGGVILKYEDGTPAISQFKAGKGFVMISGVHPTVDKKILVSIYAYEKQALALKMGWEMIDSALHSRPMRAFDQ